MHHSRTPDINGGRHDELDFRACICPEFGLGTGKVQQGAQEQLKRCGGVEEDRTPDLRIANATLSQLSYHPTGRAHFTGTLRLRQLLP